MLFQDPCFRIYNAVLANHRHVDRPIVVLLRSNELLPSNANISLVVPFNNLHTL